MEAALRAGLPPLYDELTRRYAERLLLLGEQDLAAVCRVGDPTFARADTPSRLRHTSTQSRSWPWFAVGPSDRRFTDKGTTRPARRLAPQSTSMEVQAQDIPWPGLVEEGSSCR